VDWICPRSLYCRQYVTYVVCKLQDLLGLKYELFPCENTMCCEEHLQQLHHQSQVKENRQVTLDTLSSHLTDLNNIIHKCDTKTAAMAKDTAEEAIRQEAAITKVVILTKELTARMLARKPRPKVDASCLAIPEDVLAASLGLEEMLWQNCLKRLNWDGNQYKLYTYVYLLLVNTF